MLGCLGLALHDFKANYRLEQYNPKGVAHYYLDFDLLFPTPSLIKKAFIEPIKKFTRRDTVVFIGNSVIAGAGAEDKVFFSGQINKKNNVINAGLSGEYLPASLALATLGIKVAAEEQPDSFFHIFIAYPTTRLYLFSNASGYWVTGSALYALAKENNVDNYIFKGVGLSPMSLTDQAKYGIRNYLVMNMRCVIDRRVVVGFLQNGEPNCLEAISTGANGHRIPHTIGDPAAGMGFMKTEVSRFSESANREETLAFLIEKSKNLTRFLEDNHLKYKVHFLLLGDPPAMVEMLPQDLRKRYLGARSDYINSLRSLEPGWEVESIDSLDTSDFSDTSHMNENGQSKLASKILDLIGDKSAQDSM